VSVAQVPDDPAPFPPFATSASERIYDSPWCGLRRDQVVLPNGRLQEYHVFEISDAVAVVPVLPNGDVVLVGQYRYPHGRTLWETPAGRIDAGEQPAAAAARELLEETGHRAGRLVELPGFYPTNGISAHYAHAFCALDCELVRAPRHDDSEQIVVQRFTRAEVEALLDAGRFADGFTALSVMYWLRLVTP
jgi:ADP-ribose pyrophosphatase